VEGRWREEEVVCVRGTMNMSARSRHLTSIITSNIRTKPDPVPSQKKPTLNPKNENPKPARLQMLGCPTPSKKSSRNTVFVTLRARARTRAQTQSMS
jgi:hypothetical protein